MFVGCVIAHSNPEGSFRETRVNTDSFLRTSSNKHTEEKVQKNTRTIAHASSEKTVISAEKEIITSKTSDKPLVKKDSISSIAVPVSSGEPPNPQIAKNISFEESCGLLSDCLKKNSVCFKQKAAKLNSITSEDLHIFFSKSRKRLLSNSEEIIAFFEEKKVPSILEEIGHLSQLLREEMALSSILECCRKIILHSKSLEEIYNLFYPFITSKTAANVEFRSVAFYNLSQEIEQENVGELQRKALFGNLKAYISALKVFIIALEEKINTISNVKSIRTLENSTQKADSDVSIGSLSKKPDDNLVSSSIKQQECQASLKGLCKKNQSCHGVFPIKSSCDKENQYNSWPITKSKYFRTLIRPENNKNGFWVPEVRKHFEKQITAGKNNLDPPRSPLKTVKACRKSISDASAY